MTVVKKLFPFYLCFQQLVTAAFARRVLKLRASHNFTFISQSEKIYIIFVSDIYSTALNPAFAWFIGDRPRKNKVTIGSIAAFMKHVFRAAGRFSYCNIHTTRDWRQNEVRIRASFCGDANERRSRRDIWIGFVLLSTAALRNVAVKVDFYAREF